jgi:type IV pilus assembly protein PilW
MRAAPILRQHEHGLGLVELMIAMLLGVLLCSVLVTVLMHGRQAYKAELELGRMRENALFASKLLRRELSMAGYFGSGLARQLPAPGVVGRDCRATPWVLDVGLPVTMVDQVASTVVTVDGVSLNCLGSVDAVNGLKPDSDILVIKRADVEPVLKNGRLAAGSSGVKDSQWYVRVARGENQWLYLDNGETPPSADLIPGSGVDLYSYRSSLFYIRSYSRTPGDDIPTLCQEKLRGNAMSTDCLVEGVESLQLEWGVDRNGDGFADSYLARPSAVELASAVSARFFLLMRSVETMGSRIPVQHYTLGGRLISTRDDGYFRNVVSATVVLYRPLLAPAA